MSSTSNSFISSSNGFVMTGVTAGAPTSTLGDITGATAIPAGVSYVVVSACALTSLGNNAANPPIYTIPAISLPAITVAGQEITVVNNGLGVCAVFGAVGLAAAPVLINGNIDANGFMRPYFIAAKGGQCRFVSSTTLAWTCVHDAGLKYIPVITGATALTLDDSFKGVVFGIPAMAGGCTFTLPAPYNGFNFKARCTGTTGQVVAFTSTGTNIQGGLFCIPAAAGTCTSQTFAVGGQTTINFAATAVLGCQLAFESTNANYQCIGSAPVITYLTVA